jgi:hypothetical protein
MINRSQLPPLICNAIASIQQQNKLGLLFVEGHSDKQFLMHHLKLNEKVEIVICNGKKPAIDFYRQVKVSHEVNKYWIGLLVDHDHDFLGDNGDLCIDLYSGNVIVVDRTSIDDQPLSLDLESSLPTEKMEGIVGIADATTKVNMLTRLKDLASVLNHLRNQRFDNDKRLRVDMAPSNQEDQLPSWHKCLKIKNSLQCWNIDALKATVAHGSSYNKCLGAISDYFCTISPDGIAGPYKGHDLMFLAYCCKVQSDREFIGQPELTSQGFCRYQSALLRSLDKEQVQTLNFINRLVKSIDNTSTTHCSS